jgi:hypothetical protein
VINQWPTVVVEAIWTGIACEGGNIEEDIE